jgi:hypothetical protein
VEVNSAVSVALSRSLPKDFSPPDGREDEGEFRVEMSWQLGDLARDVSQRLGPSGPGLAIVTGPELAQLTDGQLKALLFGVSSLLGRPIGQTADGERVVSVVDERPSDAENARGYVTNARMLMHTDPTDVAALLCLRQGAHGGSGLYASAETILNALTETAATIVPEYFRLWPWDLRGMQRPDAARIVLTPIFGTQYGELICRYGSSMLRQGAMRRAGDRLADYRIILDIFDEVAQRPELALHYTLRRGESIWLNNYRILHGRERFEDEVASGMVRHLLRTWIWLHMRPAIPPEFLAFSEEFGL